MSYRLSNSMNSTSTGQSGCYVTVLTQGTGTNKNGNWYPENTLRIAEEAVALKKAERQKQLKIHDDMLCERGRKAILEIVIPD